MLKCLGFTIASYCLAIRFFISCCPLLCIHPYLIYQIEVKMKLFFILLVLIPHHFVVGHVHFCWYDCFTFIGQFERSFPCGGSHNRLVSPPCYLCPLKPSLDDLQQELVCYFCLSICLQVGGWSIMILDFQLLAEFSKGCVIKLSSII